jgi:hypothetical protein
MKAKARDANRGLCYVYRCKMALEMLRIITCRKLRDYTVFRARVYYYVCEAKFS